MDIVVGEPNVHVRVKMTDDGGNETENYDVAGGIDWDSTDPDTLGVTDDDADPKDARLSILKVGGPVRVSVSFDGDPGDGVRTVSGETEELNVVPGEATGAEIFVEMRAA